MKPIEFPEVNIRLAEDQPEYETLPVAVLPGNEGNMVACLELTDEELEEIIKTKKIWVSQLTFGNNYHPILISPHKEIVLPEAEPETEALYQMPGGDLDEETDTEMEDQEGDDGRVPASNEVNYDDQDNYHDHSGPASSHYEAEDEN